jgi:serine/threonine protein kinase
VRANRRPGLQTLYGEPSEAPEFLEGTLAYMAPEQTARMNRSVDSRSDFYSLAVIAIGSRFIFANR